MMTIASVPTPGAPPHCRALPPLPALAALLAALGGWGLASPTTASACEIAQAPPTAQPETILRGEEIIVRSTRSGRRIQDQAIRVEVLDREEIEEKLLMRPGNIAMLLAETGGIQLQNTSAGLGGSVIRIQGMPGRYTLLLADGLPLYGGQPGGLGVLQIPPVDLEQVEVIKGVASALYGGQALGGVVNLVSRRPGDEALAAFIVNGTSRGGADMVAYAETPLSGAWTGSLVSGLHRQYAKDISGSGWADLPAHERGTVRVRAFHGDDAGRSTMITVGGMMEDRVGGSVAGGVLPGQPPAGGLPFRDAVDSRRIDAGAHFRSPLSLPAALADAAFVDLRGSAMESRFDRDFGLEGSAAAGRGERSVRFLEASLSGMRGAHTWVVGAALQDDRFRHLDVPPPSVSLDFEHTVPGVFVQDEVRLLDGDLTVAGSLRWDRHSVYGSQLSPRLSVLMPGDVWTVRASAGRGFFGPSPLLDEVEAVGLLGGAPGDSPGRTVNPETGWGGSLDVGGRSGPFEWNGVAFASEVRDEATLLGTTAGFRLGNAPWRTTTRGGELLLRYRVGEISVTGSYLFVDAQRRPEGSTGHQASSPVPRTPRHATGLVTVWEDHDRGILGLELYHTGRQQLEDNPYRDESRGWLHVGVLGELRLEGWSLFVNMENLLGVRQTRWDPLLLPSPGRYGARVTDAWAPLDGFTLNAGVRIRRGGGDRHHDNQDNHNNHP
ncbi:N/A [soil metagenome]